MKRFCFKNILKTKTIDKNYPVKLLGSMLCSHPGIEEICRVMAEMYTVSRQKVRRLPLKYLTVSSKGITFEEDASEKGSSTKKFAIERIVYCGVDRKHQKIFAFFYRSPENIYGALDCHVVECHSRRHAKHIALKISEIFQGIAEEKERRENSVSRPSVIQKRTVSLIPLHMSAESLAEEQTCATPRIHFRPHDRTLGFSELQLHSNKYENNSSGYGDSLDDLSNETSYKMKQRKHGTSVKAVGPTNNGHSSQTGQLSGHDYVNTEVGNPRHPCRQHSKEIFQNDVDEILAVPKIREWDSRKDRNANSLKKKTWLHEYVNINMKKSSVQSVRV